MAQNYTKMWDAFLGGEYEGYDPNAEMAVQERDFYRGVIGPAFGLEGFGDKNLAEVYGAFTDVDFERAERTFRSEIGDPYGETYGDPFSWEKVSRYNTGDPAGVGRLQDLLEDQLYGQGKFLGGQAGADYGTATSKEVEAYSTGMRGESEALTHGALTSGASLASGTSGATIRSGESTAVAEDVLIEAYKKAKTLGTDYRAGSELIESNLEGDLNEALTTYLDAIDEEKKDWFDRVMLNVNTFKTLEMDLPAGETYETMTDADMELQFGIGGELSKGPKGEAGFYNEWSCGYGQEWQPGPGGEGGQCVDTEEYTAELGQVKFRDDAACGIGELWNEATGQCEVRDDLDLERDEYGYLCKSGEVDCAGECGGSAVVDECGVCGGDNSSCTDECDVPNGFGATAACWDGSYECDAGDCPEDTRVEDCAGVLDGYAVEDECGVCDGDGTTCLDQCGQAFGDNSSCSDECGVPNGSGPQTICTNGDVVCNLSDCPDDDWIEPGGGEPGFQHQCGNAAPAGCFKMYGNAAHYDYVNCQCIPHGQDPPWSGGAGGAM